MEDHTYTPTTPRSRQRSELSVIDDDDYVCTPVSQMDTRGSSVVKLDTGRSSQASEVRLANLEPTGSASPDSPASSASTDALADVDLAPDIHTDINGGDDHSSSHDQRESSVTPVAKAPSRSFVDALKSETELGFDHSRRYTMSSVFNRSMHTIRKESKTQAKFILTLYGMTTCIL